MAAIVFQANTGKVLIFNTIAEALSKLGDGDILSWVTLPTSLLTKGNVMSQYTIEMSDSASLLEETSMIIYGPSGIGKSTIAMNMPSPLFVIMRGGGEHRPMHLIGKHIPYIQISRKSELDQLLLDLKKNGMPAFERIEGDAQTVLQIQAWKSQGKTEAEIDSTLAALGIKRPIIHQFQPKTLVFDQLTTLYNIYMSDVINLVSRKRENPETPNMQDYGQARRRMLDFFQEINGLPSVHKVYLCLAELDVDPITSERRGLPLLAGKLAQECMAFVDFVFYMHHHREMQGTTITECRRFATAVHGQWQARDSTGKLPSFIKLDGPDFKFWDYIVKEVTK